MWCVRVWGCMNRTESEVRGEGIRNSEAVLPSWLGRVTRTHWVSSVGFVRELSSIKRMCTCGGVPYPTETLPPTPGACRQVLGVRKKEIQAARCPSGHTLGKMSCLGQCRSGENRAPERTCWPHLHLGPAILDSKYPGNGHSSGHRASSSSGRGRKEEVARTKLLRPGGPTIPG